MTDPEREIEKATKAGARLFVGAVVLVVVVLLVVAARFWLAR